MNKRSESKGDLSPGEVVVLAWGEALEDNPLELLARLPDDTSDPFSSWGIPRIGNLTSSDVFIVLDVSNTYAYVITPRGEVGWTPKYNLKVVFRYKNRQRIL